MSDGVLLSGDLSEIRLPTLLMSLYKDGETGVLSLEDENFKKALYIKEGRVVYATTTDPDERLGECLLRRGIITLQQYEESMNEVALGRKQGRVLVDIGAISPSDLVEGVTQQLYDVIFSMFRFRRGSYTLELANFSTLEMITIAIEIPAVIFRGLSQLKTWSQMRPMVGDPETRLRTCPLLPSFTGDLEMSQDHEHLLRICREGLPIASILEASFLPQFETLRALWILLTLGVMEREDPKKRTRRDAALEPEALVDQYNDVYSFVHHHLTAAGVREEDLLPIMEDLARSHPRIAPGQADLVRFGRLDVDAILYALRSFDEAARPAALQSFLEEALYALVLESDRRLPEDRRDAVRAYLKSKASAPEEVT
jgi:hypothetical protein